MFYNRKTKSCTGNSLAASFIYTIKTLKDTLLILLCNAYTTVFHTN
mgnify:CR=1 FL=1